MMEIHQRVFVEFADPVAHPKAQVWVPQEYTLVGGGGIVLWNGYGSLLTASYPLKANGEANYRGWEARAKDHSVSDPSPLLVYAIGIKLQKDGTFYTFDQDVIKIKSGRAAHPEVSVVSDNVEAVLTGGGAIVNMEEGHYGNLLTASRPTSPDGVTYTGWEARSKDHMVSAPATVTGYAILIDPPVSLVDSVEIVQQIAVKESDSPVPHPRASCRLGNDFTLTGGGGIDNWDGSGSLLTALFPLRDPANGSYNGWEVRGKDHKKSDISTVTSYAIGIKLRSI